MSRTDHRRNVDPATGQRRGGRKRLTRPSRLSPDPTAAPPNAGGPVRGRVWSARDVRRAKAAEKRAGRRRDRRRGEIDNVRREPARKDEQ